MDGTPPDDPFAVPPEPPSLFPRILAGVTATLALGCSGLLWVATQMPGQERLGDLPALDADGRAAAARMDAVVTHLAETIGERNLTGAPAALAAAADYIEGELRALGLEVRRQPVATRSGTAYNLEATIAGRVGSDRAQSVADDSAARPVVVVGAHYDTARGTPGADDNGSGAALLLEIARRLAAAPASREVRIVAFANEEPPWFRTDRMGSVVYADELARTGAAVAAMFSLETLGWYDDAPRSQHYPPPFDLFYPDTGNFVAFVGDHWSLGLVRDSVRAFRAAAPVPAEGASFPAVVEGLDWSDHAPFWRHGWPAVMVTDTAPFRNPHYHEASDTKVDTARMALLLDGVEAAVRAAAGG
jgi:hypothetical protein